MPDVFQLETHFLCLSACQCDSANAVPVQFVIFRRFIPSKISANPALRFGRWDVLLQFFIEYFVVFRGSLVQVCFYSGEKKSVDLKQ